MTITTVGDTYTYNTNTGGFKETAIRVIPSGADGTAIGGSSTTPSFVATPASIAASASFTRPADTTAYAIGDLIANNTTAGSVTPMTIAIARAADLPVLMRRVRLKASFTGAKGAIIRIHLFKNVPTVNVGDNGVLNSSETYGFTESLYLGYQDVTLSQQTSDSFTKGFATADTITEPSAGTVNIFGLLEARSVFTPASGGIFTTTIEALRD